MKDVPDGSESLRLDRVDDCAHTGVKTLSTSDTLRRPLPSLRGMLCGTMLGDVDLRAREQRLPCAGEVLRLG
jgi:hypothetical protein